MVLRTAGVRVGVRAVIITASPEMRVEEVVVRELLLLVGVPEVLTISSSSTILSDGGF